MQVINDYEAPKLETLEKLDTYPALTRSDNFEEIEKHAISLKADYLVWYGGAWVAYKRRPTKRAPDKGGLWS